MAKKTELEAFEQHPNLLREVIERQAGTLQKSLLEGVMNSVDAGASRIDVGLTQACATIQDDGRGFRSRAEIDKYFKVFGREVSNVEGKTYGRFRMGRGQLFAFGRNEWRSGEFLMQVNLRDPRYHKDGRLCFELQKGLPHADGCLVKVFLHNQLSLSQIQETDDALRLLARYVPVPIYLNGEQITRDRTSVNWTWEDEYADVTLRTRGDLHVYNQGVLVQTFQWRHFRTGGDVVSKQELKVNFARNEIMSDCPVWRKIRNRITQQAREARGEVTRDRSENEVLTDPRNEDDRRRCVAMAWQNLQSGDLPLYRRSVLPYTSKVFTTVDGQRVSANSLINRKKGRKVTVAPHRSTKASRLHATKLVTVLSDRTLETFDVDDQTELAEKVHRLLGIGDQNYLAIVWLDFNQLAAELTENRQLIDLKDATLIESVVIDTLQHARDWLGWTSALRHSSGRNIVLGATPDDTPAWTDGTSFVAIARSKIRQDGVSLSAYVMYAQLIVQQLLTDADGNVDMDEVYAATLDPHFGRFIQCAYLSVPATYKKFKPRIDKRILKQQDKFRLASRVAAALPAE